MGSAEGRVVGVGVTTVMTGTVAVTVEPAANAMLDPTAEMVVGSPNVEETVEVVTAGLLERTVNAIVTVGESSWRRLVVFWEIPVTVTLPPSVSNLRDA